MLSTMRFKIIFLILCFPCWFQQISKYSNSFVLPVHLILILCMKSLLCQNFQFLSLTPFPVSSCLQNGLHPPGNGGLFISHGYRDPFTLAAILRVSRQALLPPASSLLGPGLQCSSSQVRTWQQPPTDWGRRTGQGAVAGPGLPPILSTCPLPCWRGKARCFRSPSSTCRAGTSGHRTRTGSG